MRIGFSTGCVYKNMEPCSPEAIAIIKKAGCDSIELCAIKPERLDYLENIDLKLLEDFSFFFKKYFK